MAVVNEATGTADGSATTIASAAISHTAGNMLAVLLFNGSNNTVSSIADTAGNTFTLVAGSRIGNAGAGDLEIWVAANITGNASNVVTATFAAASTFRRIDVFQLSGRATTAPAETAATGTSATATVTSASFSPAASGNDNLACADSSGAGTYTAGANYVIQQASLGADFGSEKRESAPSGAQTAALTLDNAPATHLISVASFKAAAVVASFRPVGPSLRI